MSTDRCSEDHAGVLVALVGLEAGIGHRSATDPDSVAPPRVPAVLALEVETGKAAPAAEHSRVDRGNGQGKFDVGARPRCFGIISKARDLRLSTNGAGVLAVGPGSALPKDIVAILADVHPQSRAIDRGLRFSRCRDGAISSALRAHSHGGGKQENIALQRNWATDRRVDATAVS